MNEEQMEVVQSVTGTTLRRMREEIEAPLLAENERLRAALKDMLSVCDVGEHDSDDIYRACDRSRRVLTDCHRRTI